MGQNLRKDVADAFSSRIRSVTKDMKAGVYIHWPFCKSRCCYCHFLTEVPHEREIVQQYKKALIQEIREGPIAEDFLACSFETIYFGGGDSIPDSSG